MELKSSRTDLMGTLVLAFLMVFTVLGAVTPHADAAINTAPPTGTVMVTTEPDFEKPLYTAMGSTGSVYYPWNAQPPGPSAQAPQATTNPIPKYPAHPAVVYAKPTGGDNGATCPNCFQRTIRLAFGSTPVNQVDFIYYLRDELSTPACNISATGFNEAMDPCLPKGIVWRPEYSFVTRPGWDVSTNQENTAALSSKMSKVHGNDKPAALVMTFSYTGGGGNPVPSSIAGADLPRSLEVVIAFQVMGGPNGDSGMSSFPQTPPDEFHVQINVYPSGDSAPFETTCPAFNKPDNGVTPVASPQSQYTCVFTNPPFTGPNPPPTFSPDPLCLGSIVPPNPCGACSLPGSQFCNGTPSLVIRMDDTAPQVLATDNGNSDFGYSGPDPCICSFFSQDVDHNGHVDRFVVSFTEPVNPQTFDYHQFQITAKGRDRPYIITNSFFEPEGQCIVGRTPLPPRPPEPKPSPVPPAAITIKTPGSTCTVDFLVAEMPFYDTGDKPNLVYPCAGCASTVTDRAGNPLRRLAGTAVVALDRSPPVITSVYGLDAAHNGGVPEASSMMHVFFSENVIGSGCSDFQAGPPAVCGGRPILLNDLCYMDDGAAGTTNVIGKGLGGCFSLDKPYDTSATCTPIPKCRFFDYVIHTPSAGGSNVGTTGDGWKALIPTMADPINSNVRLKFGSSDVHPFSGDMLGIRNDPHGLSRACITTLMDVPPCDGDVRDLSDNGGWYPTGQATPTWVRPPAEAHVTFPMVKSASVDISNPGCPTAKPALGPAPHALDDVTACHYWLKLQFNGPVRGPHFPTGCDLTTSTTKTAKPFFACNLDVATAAGTGQGPQGFLGPAPPAAAGTSAVSQAPYYLAADSDTAILEMDYAARPSDVGLTPSRVKIHCNTIYATPAASMDPGKTNVYSLDPTTTTTPNQQVGVIPCDDPDNYYGPGEDFNGQVVKPDVDLVDRSPPKVLEAKTVDADHNGYLDGVQLTFSEPIDDATFCGGDLALSAPQYCPDTESTGGTGFITFSRWDSRERIRAMVDPREEECRGTFRFDTGALSNDNVGIIGHVSVDRQDDGSYITRVLDCEEYFRGAFTGIKWPTDSLLHITAPVPGLFSDLASHPYHDNSDTVSAPVPLSLVPNPNLLPAICQFESRAMTAPTSPINQLANHPNTACNTNVPTFDSVRVIDGAPPVLWKAETYDTPVVDANGIPDTKIIYNNLYGDGTIDGYRLTFSEPVSDGSFNRNDWHIEGFQKLSFTNPASCGSATPVVYYNHNVTIDNVLPGKPAMRTRDTTLNPALDADADLIARSANDNQFILLFTGAKQVFTRPDGCKELHAVGDTDTKPELTGSGTGGFMHLSDRAPSVAGVPSELPPQSSNKMLDFDTFAVQEEDRAQPEIMRIEGFAGTSQVKLYFSEPVDDGLHNGLVRDDFQYFDKNSKDVAGLSTPELVSSTPQPVQHQAGDRNVTIPLGATFSLSDQTTDKIAARFCRVYETAPSVPAGQRQCAPSFPHSLSQENDTTAPAAILDLSVVKALTNANSLTVSFTAPGDDGLGGGNVASYTCLVKEGDVAIAGNETNPAGVAFKFDPAIGALAAPGHTQTVQLAGLKTLTTYHVACFARDELGNTSPLSNDVSDRTGSDTTPPTGTLTIQSPTHPQGVPTAATSAVFTWNDIASTEKESTIVYHFALNTNPNYAVLATDPSTTDTKTTQVVPGDGTYYFHVMGYSGGGATPTAHYQIVVGLTPLLKTDIQKANDALNANMTAYRQETIYQGQTVILNNVTWSLPPQSTPPGLDIKGIEIWREDHGTFKKVTTIPGDYYSLQKGFYQDTTAGANADSKYRVDMVFNAQPNTQDDPTTGYSSLVDQTPTSIPPWVWILAGVALALILSGIVIFFILRRRQKDEASGGTAYSWESANPELLGVDEATGMPVHEVRCPSCNNPFQAVGALPLPVTCPTCGTTGQLD